MNEAEQKAFRYLELVRGKHIADWAFQEKNGTWTQAIELTSQKEADDSIYLDKPQEPA